MKQTDSVSGMQRLARCNAFATCFRGASIECTAAGRQGPAGASSSVTFGNGSAMRPLLHVLSQQACSIT